MSVDKVNVFKDEEIEVFEGWGEKILGGKLSFEMFEEATKEAIEEKGEREDDILEFITDEYARVLYQLAIMCAKFDRTLTLFLILKEEHGITVQDLIELGNSKYGEE